MSHARTCSRVGELCALHSIALCRIDEVCLRLYSQASGVVAFLQICKPPLEHNQTAAPDFSMYAQTAGAMSAQAQNSKVKVQSSPR